MGPYLNVGPFEVLLSSMYRSQALRRRIFEMSPDSEYRRSSVLRLFAWCYRRLNRGRQIPHAVLSPDFTVHQTSAFIDTAGSFAGRDALDGVLKELEDAFEAISFMPESFAELDGDRILLMVRFKAAGRGSGLTLDRTVGHLFTIRDGFAARLDVYWEESEALDAAGA
jgi:ketosteroid isomerase-like protein